jgi:cysteinyl-tRNA synthetase
MSHEILGTHFDIHGGGLDLKFPHHENEIAQSCAASGDRFANLWMHNGFVNVDDEKMSKSLGNFFTIRTVLDSGHVRHPEVLRFFLMSSHYRGPINYSLEQIEQADAALGRLYVALREVVPATGGAAVAGDATRRFREAMDDDFNTPEALAVLQSLAGEINRATDAKDEPTRARLAAEMVALGQVLGVLTLPPAEWFRLRVDASGAQSLAPEKVEALIEARREARRDKDFRRSDEIRDELAAAGVVLEDKPGGVTQGRYR